MLGPNTLRITVMPFTPPPHHQTAIERLSSSYSSSRSMRLFWALGGGGLPDGLFLIYSSISLEINLIAYDSKRYTFAQLTSELFYPVLHFNERVVICNVIYQQRSYPPQEIRILSRKQKEGIEYRETRGSKWDPRREIVLVLQYPVFKCNI